MNIEKFNLKECEHEPKVFAYATPMPDIAVIVYLYCCENCKEKILKRMGTNGKTYSVGYSAKENVNDSKIP